MTDDATRPIETPTQPPGEPATASDAATPAASEPAMAPDAPMPSAPSAAPQAAMAPEPPTAPQAAIGTTTVAPVAAGGPSRTRWIVALGVVALAAIIAVGAFIAFSSPANPVALTYIPADSVMVVEVRPELPGDQLQHLGDFLAHFPGFADQSTLTTKLDEAFSKMLASGGAGSGLDYATDIKPWLSGAAFIAVRPQPAGTPTSAMALPAGVLVSATTNGQVTCAATLKDAKTTTATYQGTDVVQVTDTELACAIQGRQGLLGDLASVHAALDAKAAGNGIDKDAAYVGARKSLSGDRLATMYMNGPKYFEMLSAMSADIAGASNPFATLGIQVPAWVYAGIRAEGDAMVMETVAARPVAVSSSGAASPGPSLLSIPPAHPSVIAAMVPSDAILFFESQGAGVGIRNMLTQLRSLPELGDQLAALDGMTNIDSLVGWVQDAGIVVTGGASPSASMIVVAADEATAAEKGGSLAALVTLAGLGGQGIEVSDETVNGVKITTLTITDTGTVLPPGSIPGGFTGPLKVSYAVKGKALLVGVGDGALTRLVNVDAGASLATDAAFKRVAARGVSPSAATLYLSVPKLIELVESMVPESERGTWTTDVKPYIAPFEAFYFVSEADGDLAQSTAIFTVHAR